MHSAGFAGESAPRAVFPMIAGRPSWFRLATWSRSWHRATDHGGKHAFPLRVRLEDKVVGFRCYATTGAWDLSEQKTKGVSQLQFSDKVVDMPVVVRHCMGVQFLDNAVFLPVACRQCWGPDVQKTVVFHRSSVRQGGRCPCFQVLGGAAGSALAVMVVPVIMQRRSVLRHWMCLRFSSSPECADTPVRSETGQLVLVAIGLFAVFQHFSRSSGFSRS